MGEFFLKLGRALDPAARVGGREAKNVLDFRVFLSTSGKFRAMPEIRLFLRWYVVHGIV